MAGPALDKNSKVTLGLALYITFAAAGGAWGFHQWLSGKFDAQQARLENLSTTVRTEIQAVSERITRIEASSENSSKYRWDRAAQREWASRLRHSNPSVRVPPVDLEEE